MTTMTTPRSISEAKKRWPRAGWIDGCGDFASVSHCDRHPTVVLFQTRMQAEVAKARIDDTGCGRGCTGRHEVIYVGRTA